MCLNSNTGFGLDIFSCERVALEPRLWFEYQPGPKYATLRGRVFKWRFICEVPNVSVTAPRPFWRKRLDGR